MVVVVAGEWAAGGAVAGVVVVVVVGVPKGGLLTGAEDDAGFCTVGVFTAPMGFATM